MTEEWKALTDVEKVPYVAASDREKQRYEGQMKVFREKKAKELAVEKASAVITKAPTAEKLVGAKRPASAATAKGEGKASKKSKDAPAAPAHNAPAAPAHPAPVPVPVAAVVEKKGKSATPGKKSATKAPTPAKKPAEVVVSKPSAKKAATPIKAATPAKKSATKKSP